MMDSAIADLSGSWVFAWVVVPILIFAARVCDVTVGTIRIISIGRGNRIAAPLLGFFEVLVWLLAIRQIMENLTNPLYYLAYAGGFAAGTFVGMSIEERLAVGVRLLRVVTREDARELIGHLVSAGYGATTVKGRGATGEVDVIYVVVRRADMESVLKAVQRLNPNAFYWIEDVRFVSEGVFPPGRSSYKPDYLSLLRRRRKAK